MMDIDFVRAQFPAFAEPGLGGQAFFENAGGSYPCKQVVDRLCEFYRKTKVQPYHHFPASLEAGEAMDASYGALATYLGVTDEEIFIGPSTSQNTYVLANALRDSLKKGDEIIVTNQDHEANSGVWRRLQASGVVVREWRIDAEGSLQLEDLGKLLGEKTRYLMFPHCSNIVGQINPVAQITAMARSVGALTVVDGVSFAGHGLPDVPSTGADIYLFSTYKTFGPHQGVMVIRPEVAATLGNQGHFFNAQYREKCLTPAGPDHAQIAAVRGMADYFDAVYEFHKDTSENLHKAAMVRGLFRDAENARLVTLMSYLRGNKKLQIIGPDTSGQRAPTVSIIPKNCKPVELVERLATHGVMCGAGHFYSYRLIDALGIDTKTGVTRFSFVHYTNDAEIDQLIEGLEREL